MTGYVLVYSSCFGCGQMFGYNPHRVPSINIEGTRRPVCRNCIERANPERLKNGLDEIVPLPDAYEPLPENEL